MVIGILNVYINTLFIKFRGFLWKSSWHGCMLYYWEWEILGHFINLNLVLLD